MYESRLRDSLPGVEERIARAVERSGRAVPVTVVAVTKGHPLPALEAALAFGLTDLGENRVGELEAKHGELQDRRARWHLIGHLQRNKVRKALGLFELLHSVGSLRLAEEVAKEGERVGRRVEVLLQVNASGEEAKGGLDVESAQETIVKIVEMPTLHVRGLMTMAPFTDDEAVLRRTFRRTRELFDACARQVEGFSATHLSMGMSNDYEIAVDEGSTMVRLGTALFGERTQ
jgi:pyridoxal phosphate enzyme (YggS family)